MTLVSAAHDEAAVRAPCSASRADTPKRRKPTASDANEHGRRDISQPAMMSLATTDAPIVSFVPHPPPGLASHHNFHQPLFADRKRPTTCQAKLDTTLFQSATTGDMEHELPSTEKKATDPKLYSPVSKANRWRRVFSRGLSEQIAAASGNVKQVMPMRISVEGSQYASNAAASSGLSADRSPSVIFPLNEEGARRPPSEAISDAQGSSSSVPVAHDGGSMPCEDEVWTPSGNHLAARLIPPLREEAKVAMPCPSKNIAHQRRTTSQSLASKLDMCAEIDDDDFDLAIASVSSYTRGSRGNKSRRPASAL